MLETLVWARSVGADVGKLVNQAHLLIYIFSVRMVSTNGDKRQKSKAEGTINICDVQFCTLSSPNVKHKGNRGAAHSWKKLK